MLAAVLLACTAAAAATARVVPPVAAAATADDDRGFESMHTVFGAECTNYMDFQSIAFFYAHRRAGVPGPATR